MLACMCACVKQCSYVFIGIPCYNEDVLLLDGKEDIIFFHQQIVHEDFVLLHTY